MLYTKNHWCDEQPGGEKHEFAFLKINCDKYSVVWVISDILYVLKLYFLLRAIILVYLITRKLWFNMRYKILGSLI